MSYKYTVYRLNYLNILSVGYLTNSFELLTLPREHDVHHFHVWFNCYEV